MTLFESNPTYKTKVAIIGSGPAGHTASIYTSRALLEPILFEGEIDGTSNPGGQLTTTTEIENFPGFPKGIGGFELTQNFREQSEFCGTKIVSEKIVKVDFSQKPFKLWTSSGKLCVADSVIVATGAYAKTLDFPGKNEFWNKGVSACAVCDGALPMFRKKPLFVIGGGDSAMEEALFLSRYGSKVYIIVRRDVLRASKVMAERAKNKENIEFIYNSEIIEAKGENTLQKVIVKSNVDGSTREMDASGLFFAIGHQPFTDIVKGQLELYEDGYIKVKAGTTETSVSGIFACGDVMDRDWRQAITSAGTGCVAGLQAQRYLEAQGLDV